MGEKLACKILQMDPNHDIDVVIPIPETSRTAALQCAQALDRPYREGFIKNRYIARTFIMPGQEMRRKTVRLKLNTVRSEFKGKVVLLIDDSIVRGTTSIELIQMAREAGAKKVYFASAAPPVRFPNVYGIDIPTRQELVAHNRNYDEIREELGADLVIYNNLSDVIESVIGLNSILKDLDTSCFDGRYVTEEVTMDYLLALEQSRGLGRGSQAATPAIGYNHQHQSVPKIPQSPGRGGHNMDEAGFDRMIQLNLLMAHSMAQELDEMKQTSNGKCPFEMTETSSVSSRVSAQDVNSGNISEASSEHTSYRHRNEAACESLHNAL